jgi:glyoxylase-like metal-dependent hydrolase (beta-lactamase superfamily II)
MLQAFGLEVAEVLVQDLSLLEGDGSTVGVGDLQFEVLHTPGKMDRGGLHWL